MTEGRAREDGEKGGNGSEKGRTEGEQCGNDGEDQGLRASVNIAPTIATPTVAMTTMNVLNFEFISWRKAWTFPSA